MPCSGSSSTIRGTSVMCAPGEDRQPDGVGVLLDHGLHDLLRRLVQTRVDDLHPGVAQRAGDDLRAAVVTVEAGLGDDDADLALGGGGAHWGRNNTACAVPGAVRCCAVGELGPRAGPNSPSAAAYRTLIV